MRVNGKMGKKTVKEPTTTHSGIPTSANGKMIKEMEKGPISILLVKSILVTGKMT